MSAKHTPGPWEAVGNLVRSPMVQPEGLPRGVQIAECRDSYALPYTDEAKANARLIAAAPDLLQELKNIANADTAEWDDPTEFEAWAKNRARAAIAKATGEAQ